ncbi:MAG: hypothetical protein QM652_12040 [Legionella sp.]|uniref:hypothetical protein n=1 Tax=Legionella sp. TaxID=459 RepID=UPI0039E6B65F
MAIVRNHVNNNLYQNRIVAAEKEYIDAINSLYQSNNSNPSFLVTGPYSFPSYYCNTHTYSPSIDATPDRQQNKYLLSCYFGHIESNLNLDFERTANEDRLEYKGKYHKYVDNRKKTMTLEADFKHDHQLHGVGTHTFFVSEKLDQSSALDGALNFAAEP